MKALIEYLNSVDPWELTGADFSPLKCGRDQYSALDWSDLAKLLPPETADKLSHSPNRSVIARWVCRGLELEKAVLKVAYDLQRAEAFRERGHAAKEAADAIG